MDIPILWKVPKNGFLAFKPVHIPPHYAEIQAEEEHVIRTWKYYIRIKCLKPQLQYIPA